jgi:hypothetical protein
MTGKGYSKKSFKKMRGAGLIKTIHQRGGSWSDFVNWVKGAASTVYNKVLKPVGNYIAEKPLSAISKVAGLASNIPTPFSGVLKGVSAATGAVGNAIGKGVNDVPMSYAKQAGSGSVSRFHAINSNKVRVAH